MSYSPKKTSQYGVRRQTFLPNLTMKKPPVSPVKSPAKPHLAPPPAAPVQKITQVNFESAFLDPREGKSWAAQLKVDSQGRVTRSFIDIAKIWRKIKDTKAIDEAKTEEEKKEAEKKTKTLMKFKFSGSYPVGSVLEVSQASGGREHNYYGRSYQLVTPQGLKNLGNVGTDQARDEAAKALGVPKLVWAF
ncbi:MAG: hypothetical protein ABSE15_00535 [Candidatus Bathyarchaeia archaeon]|jgi:hypothetical protein